MKISQLKALIGCILIAENKEFIIKEIKDDIVIFNNNMYVEIDAFISNFLPILKIYLTEDDDSLVPITQYLEHYDLK